VRTEARVDLGAIRDNVATLADRAATGAQLMAVVKADGYGHGLVPSARAAVDGGAAWLGVAFLEEALAVRAAGLDVPLLAWLTAPGEDRAAAVAAGVDLGVYDLAQLEESARPRAPPAARARAAQGRHRPVPRRRHRRDWPDLCAAAAKAEASGEVRSPASGATSPSPTAGPDHPVNGQQAKVVRAGARGRRAARAAARGAPPGQQRRDADRARHPLRPRTPRVSRSTAVAGAAARRAPRVRAAAGHDAGQHRGADEAGAAGTGVSYLHRYTTERETTLALVPLGYADGVPRSATNVGPVQLGGVRRTIAGTVCMDQFVLDVGDDEVAAGDEVLLFGPGSAGEPTAQDWAEALGTINYEIVTRVGARVPRTYT
jgi:alanine racemase